MDKPLWGVRVQAPSAPGFYRSCAAHRTMGSAHRAGWFRGEFYIPLPGVVKNMGFWEESVLAGIPEGACACGAAIIFSHRPAMAVE